MRPSPGLALLLLSLPLPSVASAQNADSTGPLRTAVSATKPMTRVRVELRGGQRFTGTLLGAGASSLAVEDESGASLRIPYADVSRYWDRRRAIAAGAIVGATAGAGAGALLGMLASGLCEYDCNTSLTEGAVIGGLLVGGIGALAGGAVGAAIPRWSLRWQEDWRARAAGSRATTPAPLPPPVQEGAAPAPERRARQIGEVTLLALAGYGGYGTSPQTGTDTRGALGGISAGLAFRMHRLTFGPEAGAFAGSVAGLSTRWTFRLDLADPRRAGAVPYAIAGAGTQSWDAPFDDVWYFTGAFGGGVTFGDRHQWRAEARWNPVLQYSSNGPYPMLFTVGAGRRIAW